MRFLSGMFGMAVVVLCAAGQHVRTTRGGRLLLRTDEEPVAATRFEPVDSGGIDSIAISGYDKPLRSLRETFFVTNHYSDTVRALRIELSYTSLPGDMLHRRRVAMACEIPPGETRLLYLTAWDRQYTYYYENTRIIPTSPRAKAYRVEILPLAVGFR